MACQQPPISDFRIEVTKGGLRQAGCAFPNESPVGGRYEVTVVGEGEVYGCGAPDTKLRMAAWVGDKFLVSQAVDWPAGPNATLDAAFDTATATDTTAFSVVTGSILGADGKRLPPATRVEAYVGDTLCAEASIPAAVLGAATDDPDTYELLLPGPSEVPGCLTDAPIAFRVGGKLVPQTVLNHAGVDYTLDLVVPASG